MKAVTVAGGSSDEPEIESETTVQKAEPEPTNPADAGEAGPEGEAEAETRPEVEHVPAAAGQSVEAEAPKARTGAADAPGPKAEREPRPEPEAQADPRPGGEPARGAGTEPEDGAHSDVEAEDTPADPQAPTDPRSGAAGAPGPKAGRPETAAGADAAAAAPKTRAGSEAQADPRTPAGSKAEAENRSGGVGTREPRAGRTETAAGADAPKSHAGSKAEAEGRPGDADTRGAGRPEAETGIEPEAQAAPRPEDAAHSDAPAQVAPAKSKAPSENRSGSAPEPGGEAGLEDEDEADSGSEPATEASDAGPKVGADVSKSPAGAEAQADPRTPAGSKAKAEDRTGGADPRGPKAGRTGAETGADASKAHGDPRSGDAPEPGGEAGLEDAAHAPAEPKAQGESRSGDAGTAKGGPAAGADETQVIARPGAGPRTGPSWARDVEPDAERTSQFVALKDLDTPASAPAPVAPRPAPPAATATPAPQPPPLELLADLTNTPPPAETPRRTALRRVKIWTPILLLLVGAGAGAQLLRPLPAAQLVAAESDHTVDGKFSIPWPAKGQGAVRVSGSGDLGTFGEEKPVPTASVAKVMTAYVILKNHPLRKTEPGPDITVDAKTVSDGTAEHESRIPGLTAGSKFSQQDMLKMLMIPSGNNVARLLARWDSGTDSEAAFVEKMNAAAKELGMTNTTYTDPSGLDARTVSTAADQLKLAEAVMKDETFRSIVALPNATIKGLSQRLENNNILLNAQGLSIRGIKTGSSTPAGGTLMWAAYKSIGDETPLILGTLMDQHVDGPDEDGGNSLKLVLANSKTIIEAVRTALASVPVIRKGDIVGHVDDGLGGRTPLVAAKDLNVIGVPGQQLKLSLAPTAAGGPLPHTAKDGAEVAVLTVGSGEGAKSVPVAVKGALVEPSFGTRLTRGR